MELNAAHVLSDERDEQGRCYAMTMFNRQEKGVLVYAGRLRQEAESKVAEEITREDYDLRQTASFMWWRDVRGYFAHPPYRALAEWLFAEYKRHDSPTVVDPPAARKPAKNDT